MGLPGAGKTTLSLELAKMLNAVHFNADEIRKEVNKDLGFEPQDRNYADTTKMFIAPNMSHVIVNDEGSPLFWANKIKQLLIPTFNSKAPTAFMLGRYQPFHEGHKKLIAEAIKRVGQACIAIRDTQGTDDKNPFSFEEVEQNIRKGMLEYEGKYTIIRVPNITNIFYGRDVGYKIELIELDDQTKTISATKIRSQLQGT